MNPVIFADVFNQFLYHGEQIIKSEEIHEADPTEIGIVQSSIKNASKLDQFNRDILKNCSIMASDDKIYCLLGIENQSYIDYAMPIRCLLYDSINLTNQVSMISRRYDSNSPNEFLSDFGKDDKIRPVITLVVYYGADRWDGPRTVREMYDPKFNALDISEYCLDYRINLIEPCMLSQEQLEQFHTDMKQVMMFARCSDDSEKIEELVNSDPAFKNFNYDAALMIQSLSQKKITLVLNENGGVNLCKGINDMCEAHVQKGKIEGIREGIRGTIKTSLRYKASKEETISNLMEFHDLSRQSAEEYYDDYQNSLVMA